MTLEIPREEYVPPSAEALAPLTTPSLLLDLSLYSSDDIDFDLYEDYGEL